MRFKYNSWILIAFLTLITALVWLGVTVKTTLNKPTIPESLETIAKPLNPELSKTVFTNLKNRLN